VTRITASALELPFADGDFDTVVALDLLEHIPPADRPAALLELRRVAGKRLIVGCPCDAAAEEADRSLLGVYERVGRPVPGWLSEHLAHGLPRSNELLAASRPGDDVQLLANCTVRSHLRVMTLEAQPVVWRAAAAAGAVSAWMLRQPGVWRRLASSALHALRGRDRAPTYRTIAVITIPCAAA
jgi:SAM-dependent methyltransferase